MKKLAIVIILTLGICLSGIALAKEYKIGVLWTKDASLYDGIWKGFTEKTKLLKLNINLEIINAKGKEENMEKALKKFESEKKDLLITMGTKALVFAVKHGCKLPILATGCQDPVGLGLAKSHEKPGGNLTAVTYVVPVEKQLKLFKMLIPSLKKIGLIYYSKNAASKVEVPQTEEAAQKLHLDLVLSSFDENTKEARQKAVKKLISEKVDAIIIPTNAELYDHMDEIIEISGNTPILAYTTKAVKNGAIATLAANLKEVGAIVADKAKEILVDGKNPGDIPIGFVKKPELWVNIKAIKRIRLKIKPSVLSLATHIIK